MQTTEARIAAPSDVPLVAAAKPEHEPPEERPLTQVIPQNPRAAAIEAVQHVPDRLVGITFYPAAPPAALAFGSLDALSAWYDDAVAAPRQSYIAAFDRNAPDWPAPLAEGFSGAATHTGADVDPWAGTADTSTPAPAPAPTAQTPAPTPKPAPPVVVAPTPAPAPKASRFPPWAVALGVAVGGTALAWGIATVLGPKTVPRRRTPLPARFTPRVARGLR